MIPFTHDTLTHLDEAITREWLETNGLGGFSASTIVGINTRRYHGLLTAATRPPVGRIVMLSKLEETLVVDGRRYELSANQYPGVIHPRGYLYQTGFRLDPFPVFTYEVEGLLLEKSVFMVQGQNTTVVHYELHVDGPPEGLHSLLLEVRPLIAFRDYHGTTYQNDALDPRLDIEAGITTVKPYSDLPALHFSHDTADLDLNRYWYRNFEYAIERERGLDYVEDLFSPFALKFDLVRYARARIIASTERHDIRNGDGYRETEIHRRKAIAETSPNANELVGKLVLAADQFVVARADGKTVIAGYPWFSDWGRDTMIALPGLTLTTGRAGVAKSILCEFARHVDQGMLPNRFPDAGEQPEYNTVDATLWFFEAVRSLLQYTHDYDFVRARLYDVLLDMIGWHERGTRFNIHLDTDGLLYSGEPGVQLTWMDVKVGGRVITPRHGKPVEIQALWYNALRVVESLAEHFGEEKAKRHYREIADRAYKSFNELFWNAQAGCLYDVVNGGVRDASIRPNQIFAISLANSMVTNEKSASILRVMERELLTPRGLRTLSPGSPGYRGRYEGSPLSRDEAYHEGTVWPWLMGAYITAYVKTFGPDKGREMAEEWLKQFEEHLNEACLGQVSEIFDADPPHTARGCFAQAWSVAELLRTATEDVYTAESSAHVATAP